MTSRVGWVDGAGAGEDAARSAPVRAMHARTVRRRVGYLEGFIVLPRVHYSHIFILVERCSASSGVTAGKPAR
jgi:hypothetical protein